MNEELRLRELAADLAVEIESLDRLVVEAARCLEDLSRRDPTYLELRGSGAIVHDFYTAVERLLERVAHEMNGGLPRGPDSHAQLLKRASRAVEDVRPAVVGESVAGRLGEYLRFRYLFRHRYGFDLEWERIVPLLRGIGTLAPEIHKDLAAFVAALRELADRLGRT